MQCTFMCYTPHVTVQQVCSVIKCIQCVRSRSYTPHVTSGRWRQLCMDNQCVTDHWWSDSHTCVYHTQVAFTCQCILWLVLFSYWVIAPVVTQSKHGGKYWNTVLTQVWEINTSLWCVATHSKLGMLYLVRNWVSDQGYQLLGSDSYQMWEIWWFTVNQHVVANLYRKRI